MTGAGGKTAEIQEVIHKLRHSGAVDADGHILESAKCWEENCESKYRANALRLREDKDGLQYFEINGKPSRVNRAGIVCAIGLIGEV